MSSFRVVPDEQAVPEAMLNVIPFFRDVEVDKSEKEIAPERRAARVQEIRRRIQSGQYHVPAEELIDLVLLELLEL